MQGHEGRDRAGSRRRNELSAVIAERGIELRKKGRGARRPMSLPRGEDAPLHDHAGEEGLYHCFGCGAAGDVIGFVTQARPRQLRRCARDTRAPARGSTWSKLMEGRPRIPAEDTAPSAHSSQGSKPHRPPPGRAPLMARRSAPVLPSKSWSTTTVTFCAREDAQDDLRQARDHRPRPSGDALKIGYADGSLLKTIPKDWRRPPRQLRRARRDHARGPRAPRRLHRHPDPRPAHRPVGRTSTDVAFGPLGTATSPALSAVLSNFQAARGSLPRSSSRSSIIDAVSLPPGRRRHRDPDLRHERLHAGPPRYAEARRRQAHDPRPGQRRTRGARQRRH